MTPLARARGLGSARTGAKHWWAQRVTAIALAPLVLWFIASFIRLAHADHAAFVSWLSTPLNTILAISLVVLMFHHAALGLQVVAEDYLHDERIKIPATVAISLTCFLLAVAGVVAIIRIVT